MSFIPMAEETGLMEQIEDWVMQEAFEQTRIWHATRAHHASLTISVNLSANRFQHPDLVERVASLLLASGVDATSVQLEITHYNLLHASQTTSNTLRGLKDLGVGLTLDNFGAGYSSLSYLGSFTVDFLSIDKSYIAPLGSDDNANTVVEAMVSLAHTLGLQAIGEGVENAEQLRLLREIGCELAQGHCFSEPVPGQEVFEVPQ